MRIGNEQAPESSSRRPLIWVLVIVALALPIVRFLGADWFANAALRQWARATARPDTISLDIGLESIAVIEEDRRQALAEGARSPSANRWVPMELRWDGAKAKGRVRLKGAFSDHWRGTRWSLKLRLKGDQYYQGLRSFSLQAPETHAYLVEHLFQRALQKEGLLNLRSNLVSVSLNGDSMGLYSLLESPSKLGVERAHRREGPLLQIGKEPWLEYRRNGVRPPPEESYWRARVRPSEMSHFRSQPGLREVYRTAIARLEAFRLGRMTTSEVFDADQVARVAALVAVFGSYEFDWKDLVFYYDPLSGLFDVIAKEVHPSPDLLRHRWWLGQEGSPDRRPWVDALFRDARFSGAFVSNLTEFCNDSYLSSLEEETKSEIARLQKILWMEKPTLSTPYGSLRQNCGVIRGALEAKGDLSARMMEDSGRSILRVTSQHPFALEIVDVRDSATGEPVAVPARGATLVGGARGAVPTGLEILLEWLDSGPAEDDLRVTYRIPGTDRTSSVQVVPWEPFGPRGDPEIETSLTLLDSFFVLDRDSRTLQCREQTRVNRSLLVPFGYKLECGPGSTLHFESGGGLLLRGAIRIEGSKEAPVNVTGDPGNLGLAVLRAAEPSRIEFARFHGLASRSDGVGVRQFSGAVTFYDSDVSIVNSTFSENRSGDDSLNVVRGEIMFQDVLFNKSLADGLDLDFVQGNLTGLRFLESGNDGLDASGSHLRLRDISVFGAGDKGISIGEGTFAEVSGLEVERAQIGIASKDSSEVVVREPRFDDCDVGFAAYQKKPEFGPARIVVYGYRSDRTSRMVQVGEGSTVSFVD